jgi:lipopolysaccharide transport system ATP-binding protein
MSTAISAHGLSKHYLIRHQAPESYLALRDVLTEGAKGLLRRLQNPKVRAATRRSTQEEFWALRDVSFEVREGERVGIIGRNGAGKSTLLKILSRITDPSAGSVRIRGRVASLLEVGTGFHPELTGRENIYLNGAIIGMSNAEITRRFDEIVAFAEVERFLDTPVKRYSSGMYVRLAFGVAAHLDSEILLVDEVLAVGDAAFQRKCMGRMDAVSRAGRTVLFVSHNMGAISSLCDRAILLDAGRVAHEGHAVETILRYYNQTGDSPFQCAFDRDDRYVGDGFAQLLEGAIETPDGKGAGQFDLGEAVVVSMRFRIKEDRDVIPVPNFHFFSSDGTYAFVSAPEGMAPMKPGTYETKCHLPPNLLNDGAYFVGLAVTSYSAVDHMVHFFERTALSFSVRDPMEPGGIRYGYVGPIPGLVRPQLAWSFERVAQ